MNTRDQSSKSYLPDPGGRPTKGFVCRSVCRSLFSYPNQQGGSGITRSPDLVKLDRRLSGKVSYSQVLDGEVWSYSRYQTLYHIIDMLQ